MGRFLRWPARPNTWGYNRQIDLVRTLCQQYHKESQQHPSVSSQKYLKLSQEHQGDKLQDIGSTTIGVCCHSMGYFHQTNFSCRGRPAQSSTVIMGDYIDGRAALPLCLTSLQTCRLRARATMMYRAVNNLIELPSIPLQLAHNISRGHSRRVN